MVRKVDIGKLREKYNLTQQQLSEMTGYSQGHLSKMESGERKISGPMLKLLELIEKKKGRI